jgi:hypothetical protein
LSLIRRRKNLRGGSIFEMKRFHAGKGREFSANVPKGELTARASKEDKHDTEIPSPDKTTAQNYKLTQQ